MNTFASKKLRSVNLSLSEMGALSSASLGLGRPSPVSMHFESQGKSHGTEWKYLKDRAFNLDECEHIAKRLLTSLRKGIKVDSSALGTPAAFHEAFSLLREAFEHKQVAQSAVAVLREFLTSEACQSIHHQAYGLLTIALRSPFACKAAIKVFAECVTNDSSPIQEQLYEKIVAMLGPIRSGEFSPSNQQSLGAHILLEAFAQPESTMHSRLAMLCYERREAFLRNVNTCWDPPWEDVAFEKMNIMMKASGNELNDYYHLERIGCESFSSNPFFASVVSASRHLSSAQFDEVIRCYQLRLRKHQHPSCDLDFVMGNRSEQVGARWILDLDGFGRPDFEKVELSMERGDLLLNTAGVALLKERANTAPIAHCIDYLETLCTGYSPYCAHFVNFYKLVDKRVRAELGEESKECLAIGKVLETSLWKIRPFENSSEHGPRFSKKDRKFLKEFLDSIKAQAARAEEQQSPSTIQQRAIITELDAVLAGIPKKSDSQAPEPASPSTITNQDTEVVRSLKAKAMATERANELLKSFVSNPLESIRILPELASSIEEAYRQCKVTGGNVSLPLLDDYLLSLGLPVAFKNLAEGSPHRTIYHEWKEGNASIGIGWNIGSQLERCVQIETAVPNGVRRLYQEFGILHPARYPVEILIKQLTHPPSRHSSVKPIHLFFSRHDHNGAFFQSNKVASLARVSRGPLVIQEFSSPSSLARRALWARRRFGPLCNIGILGHGSSSGDIDAPAPLKRENLWAVEMPRFLARLTGSKLHVFVGSCYSGDRNSFVDSLAQRLHGRDFTLVGSTGSHATASISFSADQGFSLFSTTPTTRYVGTKNGRVARGLEPKSEAFKKQIAATLAKEETT